MNTPPKNCIVIRPRAAVHRCVKGGLLPNGSNIALTQGSPKESFAKGLQDQSQQEDLCQTSVPIWRGDVQFYKGKETKTVAL